MVDVEFRYNGKPDKIGCTTYSKTLTIGIYDTFDDAIDNGNKFLERLELVFILIGEKERFGKTNGPFRSKTTLISNLGYLKTPFAFYAQITTLNFADDGEFIAGILSEIK